MNWSKLNILKESSMMKKQVKNGNDWIEHFDGRNIMDEITDESYDLFIDENLKEEILSGDQKRKLKNVKIKMDPLQVKAIKRLSTMKSIPYQTLIRHWLEENIKSEFNSLSQ